MKSLKIGHLGNPINHQRKMLIKHSPRGQRHKNNIHYLTQGQR